MPEEASIAEKRKKGGGHPGSLSGEIRVSRAEAVGIRQLFMFHKLVADLKYTTARFGK